MLTILQITMSDLWCGLRCLDTHGKLLCELVCVLHFLNYALTELATNFLDREISKPGKQMYRFTLLLCIIIAVL